MRLLVELRYLLLDLGGGRGCTGLAILEADSPLNTVSSILVSSSSPEKLE